MFIGRALTFQSRCIRAGISVMHNIITWRQAITNKSFNVLVSYTDLVAAQLLLIVVGTSEFLITRVYVDENIVDCRIFEHLCNPDFYKRENIRKVINNLAMLLLYLLSG